MRDFPASGLLPHEPGVGDVGIHGPLVASVEENGAARRPVLRRDAMGAGPTRREEINPPVEIHEFVKSVSQLQPHTPFKTECGFVFNDKINSHKKATDVCSPDWVGQAFSFNYRCIE